MNKRIWLFAVLIALCACVTAFTDKTAYVLDPPNHNLRGHAADGSDDKPEASCDPTPVPSHPGELRYPCVAHYLPDYEALLKKINDLEVALQACQQQGK